MENTRCQFVFQVRNLQKIGRGDETVGTARDGCFRVQLGHFVPSLDIQS